MPPATAATGNPSAKGATASPPATNQSKPKVEGLEGGATAIPLNPTTSQASTAERSANKQTQSALAQKQLYNEVNSRVSELLPGTLELCRLLYRMKQEELYRYAEPTYASFKEWAAAEHPLAKSSFHQYLKSGRVCSLIEGSTRVDFKPENQAQLRPLLGIKDDDRVIEVWSRAAELAVVEPSGGKKVTQPMVAKAKSMVLGLTQRRGSNAPHEQLNKSLATNWKLWPERDKGQFIQTLWGRLRDYFSQLGVHNFHSESDYRWFRKRLPKHEAEAKRSAASDPGAPSTEPSEPKLSGNGEKHAPVDVSLKIVKTNESLQEPHHGKRKTVQDHLSMVRDNLHLIATEWQQPGMSSVRESQEAREAAVIILRSAIERMEAIINSFGVAGDSNVDGSKSIGQIRFSTRIISRGPRVRRVWQVARITDQIADLIRNSAPETATELKAILAELRRIGASNNRVLRISRKPVYLRATEDAEAQVR